MEFSGAEKSPVLKNSSIKIDEQIDHDKLERNKLKEEILSDLTHVFNKSVESFFNKDFYTALESIVDVKWDELAN